MAKKKDNRTEIIALNVDTVLLTGRPATIMRAMLRGLVQEVAGKDFPSELDDWECALADACARVVRAKNLYDSRGDPKVVAWGGRKFKG